MRATSPYIAHQARLISIESQRANNNPRGNYTPTEFQWGVIESINAGPPPTVNLYLDGSQTLNDTAYLTPNVAYLSTYVPVVGDTVLVHRGVGRSSSDRVVIGKLGGSTSPFPLPLAYYDATTSQNLQTGNAVWGGPGVPAATLGAEGDMYVRTDAPATAGERLYFKTSTGWVASSV